jgi:hypothetical protein
MAGIPYVGPVLGGIAAAAAVVAGIAQIAKANAERERVKAMTLDAPGGSGSAANPSGKRVAIEQAAKGRYDVVGADDNKTYRGVEYMGTARTGIVERPVLMGERGRELVIDAPTLRRLQMNAPDIVPRILQNRVTQYADGNYENLPSDIQGQPTGTGQQFNFERMEALLVATIELLSYLSKNNIHADVYLDEFEAQQSRKNKSFKTGSII